MIYNPTPVSPILGAGLEINAINRFYWDFNSDEGELQTNYQLKVWTSADVLIYDSTLLSSSNQYHDVPALTFTAGIVYKWKVTTDGKTNNSYAIFNAIDAGVLTIDALPNPFEFQFYTFTAAYTQSQNIKVKSFSFNLYDEFDLLVQTSGVLVGENPSFEFTGLDNNTDYQIECTITNQLDVISTSAKVSFTTSYIAPYAPDLAFVTANSSTGTNIVDWSAVITQVGSVEGTNSFETGVWGNALKLEANACLIYDLDTVLPKLFTSVLFLKIPSNFSGPIFKFMNNGIVDYEIGFLGTTQKFYYKRGGRFTSGAPVALPSDFFRFVIKPNSILYEIGSVLHEVR